MELWSRRGERIPGMLRELAPAADPLTRTYAARVSFDADATGADLGQSARVYTGHADQPALSVPLAAITAEAGQPYVWVVDSATTQVRRTPVQLGAYGEARVPVTAGIEAQDWIVVAGVHLLRDGQKVRPIDRSNRPTALQAANIP